MKRARKENLTTTSKARDDEDPSVSLPVDLIIDILTKLPAKSVPKFIFVSKLWSSTIQGKLFTDLYLARSLARPRLLLSQFDRGDMRFFHSTSQENPSSDRTVSIARNQIPKNQVSQPVRGLICPQTSSEVVICNPCTGQSLTLPKVKTRKRKGISSFFGYDPVNDLYKVLCMTERHVPPFDPYPQVFSGEHQVFTLGAQKKWKMIECKHRHCPETNGLCKDGVIYYGAWSSSLHTRSLVMSFDLRSEEFNPITLPYDAQFEHNCVYGLVNYNGKIALVDLNLSTKGEFDFWVLEDVNKQEWSKLSILIPSWWDLARGNNNIYVWKGTISTGELVFAPYKSNDQFYMIYYDPKEGKVRRVDIEIAGARFVGNTVLLDHVESPMFLPRKFIR